MRELSGFEYDEIGLVLGTTPAATKQLVYEARTALHEMEDGRNMSCESVRRSLSAEDRRMLRGRKLRAHLKSCAGCREFQTSMNVRQRDLAAIAPPLPAIAATALLHGLGGGGHGGGAGSLAGLASSGTGKAVATSAVAKGLTTAAVVATVCAGTAGLTGHLPGTHSHVTLRGANRVSVRDDHRPGAIAPGRAQGHRSSAAATHRSEALLGQRRNGSHQHSQAHRPESAKHPRPAARTPQGSRPTVPPRRSSSRRPVRSQPGSRAGGISGDRKTVPSTPAATTPVPTGRSSNPRARVPDTTGYP
jgi:hypothetical protein